MIDSWLHKDSMIKSVSIRYDFMDENVWISIEITLKFVPKGPPHNIPALVQIMAWCRPGTKPLSEPVMVSLLTHICVTRPQWVYKFLIIKSQRSVEKSCTSCALLTVQSFASMCFDQIKQATLLTSTSNTSFRLINERCLIKVVWLPHDNWEIPVLWFAWFF